MFSQRAFSKQIYYCSSQPFPCSRCTRVHYIAPSEELHESASGKLSSEYILFGGQGRVSYCRFTMTFRSYFFGPCAKRALSNLNSRASIAQEFRTCWFLACFLRFYSTILRFIIIRRKSIYRSTKYFSLDYFVIFFRGGHVRCIPDLN